MKRLEIAWQRLVDDTGATCDRCGDTQNQLHAAFEDLRKALFHLGIELTLKEKTLDARTFACDTSQSNRIWIAGKPLEDWLSAHVGRSPCPCKTCQNAECRTVEIEDVIFEAIPKELIERATLIAAADLVAATTEEPCCDEESP